MTVQCVPRDWTPRGKGHRPLGHRFAAHRVQASIDDAMTLPEPAPEIMVADAIPIGDQGGAGTCDPYSLARCVQADYLRRGLPIVAPSVRGHYRRICEAQNQIADLGSDPVIALDTLATWGFPTEAEWPYTDGPHLLDKLTADAGVAAWGRRDESFLDYAVIAGRAEADLVMVQRLLTSGRLVQLCGEVDAAFERGQFDPRTPRGVMNGDGHAQCISGYRVVNGARQWRIDNQWSTAFGDGGRWLATDDVIRAAFCLAYVREAPVPTATQEAA